MFKDLDISKALAARYETGSDDTAPVIDPVEPKPPVTDTIIDPTTGLPKEPELNEDGTPKEPESTTTELNEDGTPKVPEVVEDKNKKTEEEEEEEEDPLEFKFEDLELDLPAEISEEEVTKTITELFEEGDVEWLTQLFLGAIKDVAAANAQANKAKEHTTKLASDWMSLLEKANPLKEESNQLKLLQKDPILSKFIGKSEDEVGKVMFDYLSEKTGVNLSELTEQKKKEMADDMNAASWGSDIPVTKLWEDTSSIWIGLSARYGTT